MKGFEYLEPATIEEAVFLLNKYKGKARILAGGTDLLVRMKQRLLEPEYLINVKNIPHLNSIDYNPRKGFSIGALTTLHALETDMLIKEKLGVLAQAAHKVGAPRIRNIATIGGNLCQDTKCLYYVHTHLWGRSAWPCYRGGGEVCYAVEGAKNCQAMSIVETAPALIGLNAKAKIVAPTGERTIPLEDLFVSAGITVLQDDELLRSIEIPEPGSYIAGIYLKHARRGGLDFAIAGVALVLTWDPKKGVCHHARIVLNGVARTPLRAKRAERIIEGKAIEDSLIDQAAQVAAEEARPIGDIYGSATYRRKIIQVLVKRAVRQICEKIETI